mgnify:CR=1 FL=1
MQGVEAQVCAAHAHESFARNRHRARPEGAGQEVEGSYAWRVTQDRPEHTWSRLASEPTPHTQINLNVVLVHHGAEQIFSVKSTRSRVQLRLLASVEI